MPPIPRPPQRQSIGHLRLSCCPKTLEFRVDTFCHLRRHVPSFVPSQSERRGPSTKVPGGGGVQHQLAHTRPAHSCNHLRPWAQLLQNRDFTHNQGQRGEDCSKMHHGGCCQ